MQPTVLNIAKVNIQRQEDSKKIDTALPGKHTLELYGKFTSMETNILAQLRTGMSMLNESLFRIQAVPSDQCARGQDREAVEHFLSDAHNERHNTLRSFTAPAHKETTCPFTWEVKQHLVDETGSWT